jgi:hypothetical protein
MKNPLPQKSPAQRTFKSNAIPKHHAMVGTCDKPFTFAISMNATKALRTLRSRATHCFAHRSNCLLDMPRSYQFRRLVGEKPNAWRRARACAPRINDRLTLDASRARVAD